jgi:hypothetical protein
MPPAKRNGTREMRLFLEPFDGMAVRQDVHARRVLPRVDRSGHQGEAERLRAIAVLSHERHGRQRGDGGLADGEQMSARPHGLQELDQLQHIFVQAEASRGERHVARVVPVGDVDVMVGEHRAHRGAQQRGEMSRQRRHDEHAGPGVAGGLAKAQQRPEGPGEHDLLGHALDAERGPRVAQAGERNQLVHREELGSRVNRRVAPAYAHPFMHRLRERAQRSRGVGEALERLIERHGPPGAFASPRSKMHNI